MCIGNITKGSTITKELLTFKQPLADASLYFTGMEMSSVIGAIASEDLKEDEAIPRSSISIDK